MPPMKRTTQWLAAMLLLSPLGAQDQPPSSKKQQQPDAAARLKELEAESAQLVKVWQQQQREAVKAAEQA